MQAHMHAYLIIGGTKQIRLEEIARRLSAIAISPFDIISVSVDPEDEHIGIQAIRSLKKRLLLSPQHSEYSIGIIESAAELTTEAQNALLKLLEEPPLHAKIYCETENTDLLLPTIVSRCEIVTMKSENAGNPKLIPAVTTMLTGSIVEKLNLVDSLPKERPLVKEWVQAVIMETRTLMLNSQDIRYASLIRALEKAYRELSVNVNSKLAIDYAIVQPFL
jgi:hypothetical protein